MNAPLRKFLLVAAASIALAGPSREMCAADPPTSAAATAVAKTQPDAGSAQTQVPDEPLATDGAVGLGLQLTDAGARVADLRPGLPAFRSGQIKLGDLVTRVEQTPVTGLKLEQIVVLIRGAIGTPVTLELLQPETGRRSTVTLKRVPFQFNAATIAEMGGLEDRVLSEETLLVADKLIANYRTKSANTDGSPLSATQLQENRASANLLSVLYYGQKIGPKADEVLQPWALAAVMQRARNPEKLGSRDFTHYLDRLNKAVLRSFLVTEALYDQDNSTQRAYFGLEIAKMKEDGTLERLKSEVEQRLARNF
ncbi:MAG: PDZ domain-containing protein [Opitutaceae bacterium]|nr:PDZ domain-containing protein [Opitutaceae bacterium]